MVQHMGRESTSAVCMSSTSFGYTGYRSSKSVVMSNGMQEYQSTLKFACFIHLK